MLRPMVTLTQLKDLERAAQAMLAPLGNGTPDQVVAALEPRPGDYDVVFADAEAAAAARAGYVSLWAVPPRGLAKVGQTEVRAYAVLAEALRSDGDQSREFPGGYRRIADRLNPSLVWLRFKFMPPGGSSGMSYDGLVRVADHWAWFPKPWRVLGGDDE
jgi:hypothetical protein